MKELLLDGFPFTLLRFGDARRGTLPGSVRRYHQPALGHAVVTQRETLVAGRVIDLVPRVPLERLADDLRHQLEGARNTRDKAELCQGGGIVLGVPLGICDQIPRRWRTRKGSHQGRSPLLENLRIRHIAIPTFAHQGDTAILRHHQLQHRLFHIGPVVFGVAMRDANGLLVALGDRVATEGKAGRVQMMEALRNAFLDTNGRCQFAQQ